MEGRVHSSPSTPTKPSNPRYVLRKFPRKKTKDAGGEGGALPPTATGGTAGGAGAAEDKERAKNSPVRRVDHRPAYLGSTWSPGAKVSWEEASGIVVPSPPSGDARERERARQGQGRIHQMKPYAVPKTRNAQGYPGHSRGRAVPAHQRPSSPPKSARDINWGGNLWGVGSMRKVSAKPPPVNVESSGSPGSTKQEKYSDLLPELSPSPHKAKRTISQMKPKPRGWKQPSPRNAAMEKANKPASKPGGREEEAVLLPGSVPSPTVGDAGDVVGHRGDQGVDVKRGGGGAAGSSSLGARGDDQSCSMQSKERRTSLIAPAEDSSEDDDVEGSGGGSRVKPTSSTGAVEISGGDRDVVKQMRDATDLVSVRRSMDKKGISMDKSIASAVMDKLHLNTVNNLVESGIGTVQQAIMTGIGGIKQTIGRGVDSMSAHGLGDAAHMLRICVGTWNMGGKVCPDDLDLSAWLPRDKFDIYVIGVQECEQGAGVSTAVSRPKWEFKLCETMGSGYSQLAKHCIGTTHLACFVRKELMDNCHDVHTAHVITGVGSVVANKAGIGLAFDYRHTSFLFVTAHFAAHQFKVKQRNEDYNRIDRGLFPLMCPKLAAALKSKKRPNPGLLRQLSMSTGIASGMTRRVSDASDDANGAGVGAVMQAEAEAGDDDGGDDDIRRASAHFDRVFWFGDFNYRIDASRGEVDAKLRSSGGGGSVGQGGIDELLELDQLRAQMRDQAVFRGFEEPQIKFRPTYKYDKASDAYDSSKKRRVPAWTDRIVFKAGDAGADGRGNREGGEDDAELESAFKSQREIVNRSHRAPLVWGSKRMVQEIRADAYLSIDDIRTSDHRPVAGHFNVVVHREKQEGRERRDAKKKGSTVCTIM